MTSIGPRLRNWPSTSPRQPCSTPTTSSPASNARRATARMTAFSPGQSPPPVRIPIRIAAESRSVLDPLPTVVLESQPLDCERPLTGLEQRHLVLGHPAAVQPKREHRGRRPDPGSRRRRPCASRPTTPRPPSPGRRVSPPAGRSSVTGADVMRPGAVCSPPRGELPSRKVSTSTRRVSGLARSTPATALPSQAPGSEWCLLMVVLGHQAGAGAGWPAAPIARPVSVSKK